LIDLLSGMIDLCEVGGKQNWVQLAVIHGLMNQVAADVDNDQDLVQSLEQLRDKLKSM